MLNLQRIGCSRYSDLDEQVITKATELGLPLIGGTALELWAKYTNTPGVRKRSDNDMDFQSDSKEQIIEFKKWVKLNIDPDKVEVDVMFIRSHDFHPYEITINGVLTMKLEYLLWSKLTRHSKKDIQDIKWILSVKSLKDEDIEYCLEDLGVTEEEIELLQSLL